MKKTMALVAALVCSLAQLLAQEEQPATRLSRDTILIGDQIEWILDLKIRQGEEFYVEKPEEEPAPGVETITPLHFDTLSVKKGVMNIKGSTVLTCFDSGSFFLPPMIVAIQRESGQVDTIFYDGPIMEVTTIPVDTSNFEAKDIKGQIKYPVTFKELLPWIGLLLVLAGIVYVVVRWIKLRRENRSFFGRPIVQDPPHITALRALEKIRSQKLWQSDKQKQFYTAVTDTLRQYMAARYDIAALEETSAEIFADLSDKEIDPALLDKVKDLFTTADFVKFAKHSASSDENEDAIPTAVRFVNETFMQQMENEKEEE